jgi:hypothetical protein
MDLDKEVITQLFFYLNLLVSVIDNKGSTIGGKK